MRAYLLVILELKYLKAQIDGIIKEQKHLTGLPRKNLPSIGVLRAKG